ncbi:MAG: hypothetical protein IIW10_04365 [Spirochaetaceae bacterium]|nr:hypothetical protein [Spirochaetaceae bacterium]
MFENVLGQKITETLARDVSRNTLPNSLLFYGPKFSAKFTSALELSRLLSCEKTGTWGCSCPSCRIHEQLLSPNLIVAGHRSCIPEIAAARSTFLRDVSVVSDEDKFFITRLLYIRAIRKLLMRFSPVLWDGSDKISKINPLLASISEAMEEFSASDIEQLRKVGEKLTAGIFNDCQKLEDSFLPESIPIFQIRNIRTWASLTSSVNKKTVILENADKMNDNSRNALLKLLEEPGESTVLILLTEKRQNIIPTILSRLRSFQFVKRPDSIQKSVIQQVFRDDSEKFASLQDFFDEFLSLPRDEIFRVASEIGEWAFYGGSYPDSDEIFRRLNKFEPKGIFKMLLAEIQKSAVPLNFERLSPERQALFFRLPSILNDCNEQVVIYNRSPLSVLELLLHQLSLKA